MVEHAGYTQHILADHARLLGTLSESGFNVIWLVARLPLQVFHISDTLTTKLKTAHDYKLTMRTQYQITNPMRVRDAVDHFFDWPQLITLGRCAALPSYVTTTPSCAHPLLCTPPPVHTPSCAHPLLCTPPALGLGAGSGSWHPLLP